MTLEKIAGFMTMDLSDVLPDAVVVVDKRGRILRANSASESLFGYTNEELLSLALKDLVATDNQKRVAQIIRSCFASNPASPEDAGFDLAAATKDGEKMTVDLQLSKFDEGARSYAVVVLRDVTDQRRLANQIAASDSRLRALSVLSADWYWEQDANLRFTLVSSDKNGEHFPPDDAIGKTRSELPYDWESPQAREENERLLNARKPFRNLLLHNPANDRFALVSGEPVFDVKGKFTGYRGISRNVSAEKHAERALRESESHFRSLTALSSDWYWRSDENHRFTFMHGEHRHSQLIDIDYIYGKTRFELPCEWESDEVRAQNTNRPSPDTRFFGMCFCITRRMTATR